VGTAVLTGRFGPREEGLMLRAVWIALLMPLTSVSAALAQENTIERNAPADNGIGIIPWIIIALVIAGREFWTMRSRSRRR
jgi:hypothetical protein